MTYVDVGDVATLTGHVRTSAGVLANATAVTCTVTQPDTTTTTVALSNTATGTYTGGFTVSQPGRHRVRWVATGANAGAYPDVFDAFPANPRFLISLADLRDVLNLAADNTTHDEELRLYLAAATLVIEDIDRTYLPETKTYTTSGGRSGIVLPDTDITAVTSVTNDGATLDADSYKVDTSSGIVYAATGNLPAGIVNLTVTYTVGTGVVPANVRMAARELCRHWWQRSQQSTRPAFGGVGDTDAVYIAGYAVPNFVVGMLQPSSVI